MKKENSKSFEIDYTNIKSILRQIIITYTPVILIFLDQIQKWTIDPKIIIALVISTTVDVLRRYLTDYSK